MDVEIRDLQTLPVDEDRLREAAVRAAEAGGGGVDAVSIAIVDDERITRLNRRFRSTDSATDVIAFEAEQEPGRVAGEVIVSADTALRQAEEAGHDLQAELCLLVAHGVLHTLGYEDYDEQSRAEMMRIQRRVLEDMGEQLGDDE